MRSGITRLLSPSQGSYLLHGLKISYRNIFPHKKVSVLRISWPRYITYSWLAAVPVIQSPGCLTKTWYHILNVLIVNATPQRAVNARRQRKRFIHIFFARDEEEEKGQKEILWQRNVRKYFLHWFTPGKGLSIEFFGRSNITIQDNRQIDSLYRFSV